MKVFTGHIGRQQLWIGIIIYFVVIIALTAINNSMKSLLISVISLIVFFGLPINLYVRRLHDLNKSASELILLLIPFLNFYLLYCLYFKKGQK